MSLALSLFSALLMLRRRPDRAESTRLLAFAIAAPFMASGVVLPNNMAPVSTAIGLLIFLVGGVQYHVIAGPARAVHVASSSSPQVAEMVGRRGLKSATDEQTLELSVVCCDLRGFTAFTAATSSKKVIAILREYYDAVGAAATECGGTIKDQAGDGVLILVGAPIAVPGPRAARAQAGAHRSASGAWKSPRAGRTHDLHLGVGVGVASGFVTVGVIGAASRLEYTAVGPAVNLASRLCSEAAHGEVLVDARTIELLGEEARSATGCSPARRCSSRASSSRCRATRWPRPDCSRPQPRGRPHAGGSSMPRALSRCTESRSDRGCSRSRARGTAICAYQDPACSGAAREWRVSPP